MKFIRSLSGRKLATQLNRLTNNTQRLQWLTCNRGKGREANRSISFHINSNSPEMLRGGSSCSIQSKRSIYSGLSDLGFTVRAPDYAYFSHIKLLNINVFVQIAMDDPIDNEAKQNI